MDKIVHYINAHSNELNATIIYSTLDKYLDIVHGGQEVEMLAVLKAEVTMRLPN